MFSLPRNRIFTPVVTALVAAVLALITMALVDGSLTQPSAAATTGIARSIAHAPIDAKLTGFQLPTK